MSLPLEKIVTAAQRVSRAYRIESGKRFRLKHISPDDTGGLAQNKVDIQWRAKTFLDFANARLAALQEKLYAQKRWSVLIVLQAMDAAGKDGTIKHVMSGINPQGCEVTSFKAPTGAELAHTFLWRCALRVPEAGMIGIFNRSHYEDVLAPRIHPEFLKAQNLPPSLVTKKIWQERYQDINAFEKHLARNGVLVLKFYLHLSKEEQKKRLLSRISEKNKNWKFSESDVRERALWDRYMEAYEDAIRATAQPWAPWYVVPADNKWYTRTIVAVAIIDALESLNLKRPKNPKGHKKILLDAQKSLSEEV
ncbi:MAG: polyphosphate kinase 2 family protein [Proteobacteria bacterium]|nr:polyphosphate kinase 2 family protein [Pseudomonadota bacterium]MCL2308599.1 polyphosphate kinase 2 family protein [Pseudomonadota bacterium]